MDNDIKKLLVEKPFIIEQSFEGILVEKDWKGKSLLFPYHFLARHQFDDSTIGIWEYDLVHPDTFIGRSEAEKRYRENGWQLGKLEHLISLKEEFLFQQDNPIIALGTSFGAYSYHEQRSNTDYYVNPVIEIRGEEKTLYTCTWVRVFSEYGKILLVKKI